MNDETIMVWIDKKTGQVLASGYGGADVCLLCDRRPECLDTDEARKQTGKINFKQRRNCILPCG